MLSEPRKPLKTSIVVISFLSSYIAWKSRYFSRVIHEASRNLTRKTVRSTRENLSTENVKNWYKNWQCLWLEIDLKSFFNSFRKNCVSSWKVIKARVKRDQYSSVVMYLRDTLYVLFASDRYSRNVRVRLY